MMLNKGEYNGIRIVSDSTVELFTRRAAGTRALGWDTADGDGGSGEYLSERAYGHTGYTGTSLWIDPDRELFVILLTNRVHAARARRPAKVISDVRADLADAAAVAVVDADMVLDVPRFYRSDRAVGWNRAARSRSSRSRGTRARSAKTSTVKKPTAKASTKKATAKKPTAKKSSAKKPTAKKPTSSKTKS
jgi:hypothetical protein